MFEVIDEKPLDEHLDACGASLEIGDPVFAVVKLDGKNFAITDGVVSKLTDRSVKVFADGKEYIIGAASRDTVSRKEKTFFPRVIKVTEEMKSLKGVEVGAEVAFLDGLFMSSSKAFAFGTVTKLSGNYIYITNDRKETRRTLDRVRRIR